MQVPVEVVAGVLLKDNQSETVLAQVKYKNISSKSIKSISVSISARDANGVKISGVVNYVYESLIAAQGDCFGDKVPVVMSDNNTHTFSVDVISVVFSDGTGWSKRAQETVNTVEELGTQTIAVTKKVAMITLKVLAVIVNLLVTIIMISANVIEIKEFIMLPSARLFVSMVSGVLATIVSIPGFGRLIFRKKYGILQRVLRWVIVVAITVLNSLIMVVVFN